MSLVRLKSSETNQSFMALFNFLVARHFKHDPGIKNYRVETVFVYYTNINNKRNIITKD